MSMSLKVLLAEDSEADADLILRELRNRDIEPALQRVVTEAEYIDALRTEPDVILSDYTLRNFDGLRALALAKEFAQDVPFILISGTMGEELAVEAIKRGASDYLLKDRLSRLGSAITQALAERHTRARHRQTEEALRASEERFRQLAENIREIVWMIDPATNEILYVSPAYATIWGRPCEALLRRPAEWVEGVHPDDRAHVSATWRRARVGANQDTYRVLRPDGGIRWVRDQTYPVRDASGRVYRIVGTTEDITEHRMLEEQFMQAQKMEAIGTLAGGIAHDFNNILGAILGFADMVRIHTRGQPQAERHLASLRQACSRAASLVRQILAFSRQDEHSRQIVQLEKLVAEPLALLRASIPTSIVFDVTLAENLPPILADTTHIHQVVMNLCTNASHAMRGRPGLLGVKVDFFECNTAIPCSVGRLLPGPYVRLTVSDNGCGMAASVLAHVYEPFFTTKPPGEGTGLGLSVVHGVMLAHEGAASVQSAPGEGTKFELYFPAQIDAQTEMQTILESSELPRGRAERILFVDDESSITEAGVYLLKDLGYEVEGFTSVVSALDRLKSDPDAFNLVISDFTMPDMDGIEFCRRVFSFKPDLPVILTTGYHADLSAELVKTIGIRLLLSKPYGVETLAGSVRQVLDAK